MSTYFYLNTLLFAVGFTLCTMGGVYVLLGAKMDRRLDRTFLIVAVALVLFGLSALGRQYMNGREGTGVYVLMNLMCFFEYFFSFFLTYMTSGYLYALLGPDCSVFRKIADILLAVHFIMLVVSLFTGYFFSIDAQNRYSRGPLYLLNYVPIMILILIDFLLLFIKGKRLPVKERSAFLIYLVLPLASVVVQVLVPGINFGFLAGSLALFLFYFYVLSSRRNQYYVKERENAKIKIDMLMAQIQPHFLFNSLSVIKSVCKESPELAEQAIGEFAAYLRYNMNSLTREQMISFESELEHIRQYLALQKLRFGDDLQVKYDLTCTDFSIPTLSVQPLVENAVTHGIRRSESGRGTVTIATAEYPDHIEIVISDDGAGFDPTAFEEGADAREGGKGSVGIRNVRARLMEMAGGQLIIKSNPGEGTTAKVILPLRGV